MDWSRRRHDCLVVFCSDCSFLTVDGEVKKFESLESWPLVGKKYKDVFLNRCRVSGCARVRPRDNS